ncbi:hypothetical protein BIY40_03120 [Pediococcus acidilactici]|nr:hypothetical protein BIY40_03120 [Pediococcus acidilactici]
MIPGNYKFLVTSNGKHQVYKFTYTKKQLNNFVKKNGKPTHVTIKTGHAGMIIFGVAVLTTLILVIMGFYVRKKRA